MRKKSLPKVADELQNETNVDVCCPWILYKVCCFAMNVDCRDYIYSSRSIFIFSI